MSDIVKILPYRVDLGDTLSKTELHTIFVMSESLAHRFEIEIKSGGKDVDLSGRMVTASFTNFRENTTIEMIGEVKDGKVVVTLERPCYTLRGQFVLIIMVKDGDADVAVFLGEGHMRTSRAEKIIYDDYIVMDTDALLAHIAAMKSATDRANTAADRVERMQIDASGIAGDANRLGGKLPSEYLQKSQVVNNFTTTEAGFVADARSVKMLNDGLGLRLKYARITYEVMSFAPGSQSIIPTTIPEGAPESGTVIAVILYAQYDNVFYQWNPQLLSGIRDVNTYSFAVNNLRGASFSTNVRGVVLYRD